MPPRQKGARLWLRPERRSPHGKIIARSTWIILDAGRHIATGCSASEIGDAEARLAAYIAAKYKPRRKERDIEEIDIADVLSIYLDDCGDRQARRAKLEERIGRLNGFWGGKMLSEISGEACRSYVTARGSSGGARRDLEDLRAAVRHHAKEGLHRGSVVVSLPPKGNPRDRWLTRDEASRLLWVCWRTKETQLGTATKKYPLRHIARFILIGLYTGTRAAAIAAASPKHLEGRAFVDVDAGIFYRLAVGKRQTNKRQPPVPIPPRLLAHMRRWIAIDDRDMAAGRKTKPAEHFVEWNGKAVASVKTGFARAARLAGLDGVSPHTLRHTAATWLMQKDQPIWKAAGFLGMSEATLLKVYGHHSPSFLRDTARAMGYREESLVVSLVDEKKRRAAKAKTT